MFNSSVDVLCISETWLSPNTEDRFVHIPGYNIFRKDYGKGGGVCTYVRENLASQKVKVDVLNLKGVEDLWVTVQCRKQPSVIVGCIYRHPHALADSFQYISDIFKIMLLKNKPLFILGDLNNNMLNPNAELSRIIKSLKLSQVIDKPTRITPVSKSLIDVLITNKADMLITADVLPCFVADHELISAEIDIRKPRKQPVYRTFRDLSNYSANILCNNLLDQTYTLNGILNTDNVDSQTQTLTDVMNRSVDECAPIVTRLVSRPPAPWIDDNIKNSIKERDRVRECLKLDRSNTALQEVYKGKKKFVKSSIHRGRASHYKERFRKCGNNQAEKWKVARELIPDKKKNVKSYDNIELNDKIEEFNEFFSNVGKNTYEKTQEGLRNIEAFTPQSELADDNQLVVNLFRPQPVTVDDVILTFKQLKETNAVGIDGLAYRFIRDSLIIIAFYITIIVNTSIVTGNFPKLWKHMLISPTFKSGDIDDISNFRPISLLPILSKILEKIVSNQLCAFLERHNLISQTQHGFRSRLSTETALLQVTDLIYKNIDSNKLSLLVLCDLSKAFDSVHHDILLRKLADHNIDTFWFKDYLGNRIQSVKIKDSVSSVREISFGVPQGSILGPTLFTIFVNDMCRVARKCALTQFADDSQFVFSGSVNRLDEMILEVEETLKDVKIYFDMNGLMINAKKTQIIFIGSRQNISRVPADTKINFDGHELPTSTVVKNLGVYFDRYMSFDEHISELCRKTMGILLFLNRIKDKIDKETRIQIVQALAISAISYCFKIWGSAGITQIQRVQRLQNFAAKIAMGKVYKYDHATPYIRELEWLKVNEKYSYEICIFMFKRISNLIPNWVLNINFLRDIRPTITRQGNDLFVERSNTLTGERMLGIKGPMLWNRLPANIREAATLGSFKNRLKLHYLTD